MSHFNAEATVGQLVAEQPGRARVFERLGIDYCCGGKRPLSTVCAEKNLAVESVVQQLQAEEAGVKQDQPDWTRRSLTELADHIEQTHHAYLKAELPRLSKMLEKVAIAHGERHAEIFLVREVFEQMRAEMDAHMYKEEHILFPAIRKLEANVAEPCFHCGSIQNPIRVMESEHDSAGNALERMRTLTKDYAAPADACNTYRATLHALAELEADMHQHVHKENNILFPQAVKAEAEKSQG